MKRNKQSQRSLDDFMGGYSNVSGGPRWMQQYNQQSVPRPGGNPWTNILNPGGNSSSNIPGSSIMGGSSVFNPASSGIGGMLGGVIGKLQFYRGNGKKVRLFQHCYSDSSFKNGWYDAISPSKTKVISLQLGRKGQTKNEDMSAIYVPDGYDVIIHEHRRGSSRFTSGKHKIIRKSVKCLADIGWNDMVSEIDIVPQKSGMAGIIQFTKGWEARAESYPSITIGSYGQGGTNWTTVSPGRPVKPTTHRPTTPTRPTTTATQAGTDRNVTVSSSSTSINTPTSGYTPATNPSSWTSGSSSSTTTSPTPTPQPTGGIDIQDVTRPSGEAPQGKIPEEKTFFQNPLVWGGIALVVIGAAYFMSNKQTIATPQAVSVRSGRKK